MLALLLGTQLFSDGQGWNNEFYYGTMRLVACRGDLYLCCRGNGASHMLKFDPNTNQCSEVATHSAMTNAGGWTVKHYYSTIRLAALHDKLYSIGRGSTNVHFQVYNPVDNTWKCTGFPWMADAGGWTDPKYYETIRLTECDQQLFISARGSRVLYLARYNPGNEQWTFPTGPEWMTDAQGFDIPQFYSTIRTHGFPQKLYFFVRTPHGAQVAYYQVTDQGFILPPPTSLFADGDGWELPCHYQTIQTAAYETKWYIFGKGRTSLQLAEYDIQSREWTIFPSNGSFMSIYPDKPFSYETFRVGVISEKVVIFARGNGPVVFVNFNLRTMLWEEAIIKDWLSDAKFNSPAYYSTIQSVTIGDRMFVSMRGDQQAQVMCYQSPQVTN